MAQTIENLEVDTVIPDPEIEVQEVVITNLLHLLMEAGHHLILEDLHLVVTEEVVDIEVEADQEVEERHRQL